MASDRVLVIDLGAQYAQLIARRVREAKVLSEIVPRDISASEIKAADPIAIVLSGGPASVYADDAYQIDRDILELGIPILGICYGHQLLAQHLGGEVTSTGISEFGGTELRLLGDSTILDDGPQIVWMSHRDSVSAAPAGFTVTASTDESPVAAMEDLSRRMVGLQFHPEVSHTP
ncbi:MAG: glutamine-hydrolyzing GMP synthase, partial [Acidimicrobiia bacterium]|nr:glutamine-hydrolyzing GMP synthase [Acidimicrobiia bacterium]